MNEFTNLMKFDIRFSRHLKECDMIKALHFLTVIKIRENKQYMQFAGIEMFNSWFSPLVHSTFLNL